MSEPHLSSVRVDGVSLSLRQKGSGTPLLYLHDELSGQWNPFLDKLSERFHVLAPDLPGFGAGERPDWLESIEDMAFFLADLLDALLPGAPVHLVGASLGGWLALETAIRAPRCVGRLAVLGSPGLALPGDPPADYFFLPPEERPALFFNDPACAPDVDEDTLVRNETMTARLVWMPRYVSPRLQHRLHRIPGPSLVLWGADDRFVSVAHGQALVAGLPHARLQVVAGCGHFPALEKPAETAGAVADFLSANEGGLS